VHRNASAPRSTDGASFDYGAAANASVFGIQPEALDEAQQRLRSFGIEFVSDHGSTIEFSLWVDSDRLR